LCNEARRPSPIPGDAAKIARFRTPNRKIFAISEDPGELNIPHRRAADAAHSRESAPTPQASDADTSRGRRQRKELAVRTDGPVPTLNDPSLVQTLRRLRFIDDRKNLACLAREYAVLALLLATAVAWSLLRRRLGWHWSADAPIFASAILLIGAVQHRLAGLAHEASHFTFLRNRFANDLIADLFCMFPLFASVQQYRVAHFAHHQFTNDWERDPDLADAGRVKKMHRFPMTKREFVWTYFLRSLVPTFLPAYIAEIARQSVFGRSRNSGEKREDDRSGRPRTVRWTSVAGAAYVLAIAATLKFLFETGRFDGLIAALVIAPAAAAAILFSIPEAAFFQSRIKHAYSARTESLLRLLWTTALIGAFPLARLATGVDFSPYFWLLWVAPLATSFAWFMMLRDVYQHANADQGRLTNSRVFFTDPFTRWAVFVYGQDMHVPHHLFPAIPHYNLPLVHDALKSLSPEYRRCVVECHGVFQNENGRATILDVLERGTREAPPKPDRAPRQLRAA
jgi:fatty acid desaturase